jgi:hypothetical protein
MVARDQRQTSEPEGLRCSTPREEVAITWSSWAVTMDRDEAVKMLDKAHSMGMPDDTYSELRGVDKQQSGRRKG